MARPILARILALFAVSWALAYSKSLSELRYTATVPQTTWETCGAAALATLHRLLGLEATEGEMLERALRHQEGLKGGLNALSLVRASGERGLPLRGYRMDSEALRAYFARGGLPVILHVTRPELHWVVGVALVGGRPVAVWVGVWGFLVLGGGQATGRSPGVDQPRPSRGPKSGACPGHTGTATAVPRPKTGGRAHHTGSRHRPGGLPCEGGGKKTRTEEREEHRL